MSFKFTQTGREFASPRSFVNHVHKHCVKHNLNYSFVVQKNYDLQFGKKFCPHCGKEGDSANMKRWHLNNCKLKEQKNEN